MRIDEPVRLTRGFWLLYLTTLVPVLWLTLPYFHELPTYSLVAAALLFPFLSALFVYVFYHFAHALVSDFAAQRVAFISFAVVLAALLIGLTIVWWLEDFGNMPASASFVAVILSQLLFAFCEHWLRVRRKEGS